MIDFDPISDLKAIREKLPPIRRSSKFTPYLPAMSALRDSGAAPREIAAWLAERGVVVTPQSVSSYLRRQCAGRKAS